MKAVILGSFRKHYKNILAIINIFEENSIEVLSPKKSSVIDENVDFVILNSDNPSLSEIEIQYEVFRNVSKSDFVYVCNPDGYVGKTVCYELGVLTGLGIKNIYFKEYPNDLPIYVPNNSVWSIEMLIKYIKNQDGLPIVEYDDKLNIKNLVV